MRMRVALYRGVSPLSRAIRWQTRGEYSHAAIVLPCGSVIEAWPGGVQENPCLGKAHTPGTRVDLFDVPGLTGAMVHEVERFLRSEIGCGYDYLGVLRFVSRRRGAHDEKWFCSELVFEALRRVGIYLLARVEAWRVSPTDLGMSPLLLPAGSGVTEEYLEDE